ncbi:uncharacterized protein si:dkey-9i23.16 [Epinephelus fuscoguttatus]|uniref:uncharacterized protein si:dkey-9i23.16 n=1 Tax=Epinephelus fuscoguttatus TaxID=293821 RepID=UPI0020D09FC1|nr:uncharacterized protein si:dkey-9i23.16 [Epinephelus fuscoguttatus]
MSSEGAVAAAGPRLHRLFPWFDTQSAAVVTILLGLFQILLCVPLAYVEQTLPKLFVAPLIFGILIVAAGSITFANERNSNKLLLQGCVYSNAVCLLGTLLSFCLYCYCLSTIGTPICEPKSTPSYHFYRAQSPECAEVFLTAYSKSLKILLLLYSLGALVIQSILSVSAFKTLKTE